MTPDQIKKRLAQIHERLRIIALRFSWLRSVMEQQVRHMTELNAMAEGRRGPLSQRTLRKVDKRRRAALLRVETLERERIQMLDEVDRLEAETQELRRALRVMSA